MGIPVFLALHWLVILLLSYLSSVRLACAFMKQGLDTSDTSISCAPSEDLDDELFRSIIEEVIRYYILSLVGKRCYT